MSRLVLLVAFMASSSALFSQNTPEPTPAAPAPKVEKPAPPAKWYDKLSLRGYAQMRYNRLLETNPDLKCDQCDRSIGKGQGFGFRRARLIFSGNAHERLFTYIQFDYSSDASSTNRHFLQVRDAYFDYALDAKKEFRLRFGQSKVPFGFENLQSSSNRLPLDRADALNSGAPNERDIGLFFMYAPAKARHLYKDLNDKGLKGSGDYGVATIGLYNGQGTNRPESNDNLHAVARLSYPFHLRGQIFEPGIFAYSGKYTVTSEQVVSELKRFGGLSYLDQRVGGSLVLYAQPFGVLAEYNVGKSPGFDPVTDSIRVRNLKGGFVTLSYRTQVKGMPLQPFVRLQQYEGAKKHETDARFHEVKEVEFGAEWQINPSVELTLAYMISHRKYQDFKAQYDEKGQLLRIQMQFNY